MTLAECILLEDLSKIYGIHIHSKVIDIKKLGTVIENLLKVKYYSMKLLVLVAGMIQTKGKDRITSG